MYEREKPDFFFFLPPCFFPSSNSEGPLVFFSNNPSVSPPSQTNYYYLTVFFFSAFLKRERRRRRKRFGWGVPEGFFLLFLRACSKRNRREPEKCVVRGLVGPVCVWLRWELLLYDLKGNIVTEGEMVFFFPK
jgi:hypothetical protein